MNVSVSIKVRREIVELADKMVKYGLARSRNHAFNILIERAYPRSRKRLNTRRECIGWLRSRGKRGLNSVMVA